MMEYLTAKWQEIKETVAALDAGVELGGVMLNPWFVDLLLVNVFANGKNHALIHVNYVFDQKQFLVEYLFFFTKVVKRG